jgi:hypothetical protein
MRSFHPALLFALCMYFAAITPALQEPQISQATAALTNKDIVTMVSAGLSQEIIIAKIKSSACRFDTSPDKLAELKNAGVQDAVILAIVQAPAVQPEVFYVKCGFGEVGVHEGPSTSPSQLVVAKVNCGDAVTSIGQAEGGFQKVRTAQGVEGFITTVFISKTKQEEVKVASDQRPSGLIPPNNVRAIAWRAVPWVTTSYYQQPGSANTSCTGSGTWLGNIYQGNASCTTQYTPSQQVPINWTHFTIYNQVETEDSTLVIACTRNWAFSKCTHLVPGDVFSFERKGGKIAVTGQRGKNKTEELDFDIVSNQPKANR